MRHIDYVLDNTEIYYNNNCMFLLDYSSLADNFYYNRKNLGAYTLYT